MKKLWVIIIIGIILRIILSLSSFHSDIQAFNLAGKIVASGNILNLYDYLPKLPANDPIKNLAIFNYPPAVYLYHGIFNFLFSNILGIPQVNQFLLDNPANYGNIQFGFHLLFLKLPYVIFDLFIGFIFLKLFNSRRKSTIAFVLWIFNPVNLYSTYMMGQFDIIPTFFTILSVYLVVKNRLEWSAVALGFGVAFKLFPLFLVIPLLILGKNYWVKLKLFTLAMLPYFLSIIPYLPSHNFRTIALFASQSSKSLYGSISLSGGEAIILFPAFLVLFYLFIWGDEQGLSFINKTKIDIWKLYLIPLLLFFIFTHFHPQWLLWVTPFLILDLVETGFKNLIPNFLILLSWFGAIFFFDPGLNIGMFAPIAPILYNTPGIWILLHLNPDYNIYRSLLQTIFVAASAYIIYVHFPGRKIE